MPIEVKLALGGKVISLPNITAGQPAFLTNYHPENPELLIVSCDEYEYGGKVYRAPLGVEAPDERIAGVRDAEEVQDIAPFGNLECDFYTQSGLGKLLLRHYLPE